MKGKRELSREMKWSPFTMGKDTFFLDEYFIINFYHDH